MNPRANEPDRWLAGTAPQPGPIARLMQAWFGPADAGPAAGEPFRDSDFDCESGFFGVTPGKH